MCKEPRRVILINPSLPQKPTQLNIPVSLLYLGTWLSHTGYEVNILDAFNHNIKTRLREELNSRPLAVGLSVMTAQISSAIEISKFIRTQNEDTPIIWGGIHPTLYPKQVVENDYVDFAVVGEGEITTVELLEAIDSENRGFPPLLYGTKGIAFEDIDGSIITTSDREPMDINELPCPKLDLLEDVRAIGNPSKLMKQVGRGLPLLTSKGCPHKCTFCINSVTRQPYRFRRTIRVLQDLEELLSQGITEIGFVDEDFLANKPRLIEILNGIESLELGFKWFGTARADYFRETHINQDLLRRIKESGCQQLGIGLESGSQRILDMIRKDITIKDSYNTARLLNEVGIDASFSYMDGLPDETPEEIKKTSELVINIASINNNFRVLGPFIYRPYAGSELYNRCLELGMKEPVNLEDWASSPYIGVNISPKDYSQFPWVQYPIGDLVRLNFYCWMSGLQVKWYWLTKIIRKIGAWRCKHLRFYLPMEMWLLYLLRLLNLEKRMSKGKFN